MILVVVTVAVFVVAGGQIIHAIAISRLQRDVRAIEVREINAAARGTPKRDNT